AKYVGVQAPLRLWAQRVAILREVLAERGLELRLARLVADRVDLELDCREANLGEQTIREVDDLHVRGRLRGAVALEAPLPELPEAKQLWTLAAEHRLPVEESDRLRRLVEPVLEQRARDRGGALRAQREPAFAALPHLIHLVCRLLLEKKK